MLWLGLTFIAKLRQHLKILHFRYCFNSILARNKSAVLFAARFWGLVEQRVSVNCWVMTDDMTSQQRPDTWPSWSVVTTGVPRCMNVSLGSGKECHSMAQHYLPSGLTYGSIKGKMCLVDTMSCELDYHSNQNQKLH